MVAFALRNFDSAEHTGVARSPAHPSYSAIWPAPKNRWEQLQANSFISSFIAIPPALFLQSGRPPGLLVTLPAHLSFFSTFSGSYASNPDHVCLCRFRSEQFQLSSSLLRAFRHSGLLQEFIVAAFLCPGCDKSTLYLLFRSTRFGASHILC